MKKAIIIIVIFMLVDLITGYFLLKNIDFTDVDGIGRQVSLKPNVSTEATTSAQEVNEAKDSTLYVECEIDGVTNIVSAKACEQARNHFSEMAP
jgi:hypothetical protein